MSTGWAACALGMMAVIAVPARDRGQGERAELDGGEQAGDWLSGQVLPGRGP